MQISGMRVFVLPGHRLSADPEHHLAWLPGLVEAVWQPFIRTRKSSSVMVISWWSTGSIRLPQGHGRGQALLGRSSTSPHCYQGKPYATKRVSDHEQLSNLHTPL